jgi:hypothetical protein
MSESKNTVIKHIKFARSWLEKAENEFSSEETIKGELTLTLVQAEVKHAWEASRRAKEVAVKEDKPHRESRGYPKFLSSLALVTLLTVVVFNFVFRYDMGRGEASDFSQLLANGIEKKVVEMNKEIPKDIQIIDEAGSSRQEGGTDSSGERPVKERDPMETHSSLEGEH